MLRSQGAHAFRMGLVNRGNARLVNLADGEWAKVREKASYGEKLKLAELMAESVTTAMTWFIATMVVEWSFKDEAGDQIEVTEATVYDLDEETAEALRKAIDPPKRAAKEKGTDPPNRRGARSRKS